MKITDIKEATDMVRGIPATDVLVPLQTPEEGDLTPYPTSEYDVLFDSDIDKLIRNVNARMSNGWHCDGGIQVVSTPTWARYYQAMERWVIKDEPLWEWLKFLENEPDLYEDVEWDAEE